MRTQTGDALFRPETATARTSVEDLSLSWARTRRTWLSFVFIPMAHTPTTPYKIVHPHFGITGLDLLSAAFDVSAKALQASKDLYFDGPSFPVSCKQHP